MDKSISFSLAILVAGCTSAPERPLPVQDPQGGAPVPEYRSGLEGYRAFADQALAPWREANEQVRSAGGHVGILKSHGGHQ